MMGLLLQGSNPILFRISRSIVLSLHRFAFFGKMFSRKNLSFGPVNRGQADFLESRITQPALDLVNSTAGLLLFCVHLTTMEPKGGFNHGSVEDRQVHCRKEKKT